MSRQARELLMEVSKLTEIRNIRLALKESFKGTCITGATTMMGGLFLGPLGLAVGGVIGGCTAAYLARNKFKSVPEIIMQDLTTAQQIKLATAIRNCASSIEIRDVADFALRMAQDPSIASTIAMTVISFLQTEMSMSVVEEK